MLACSLNEIPSIYFDKKKLLNPRNMRFDDLLKHSCKKCGGEDKSLWDI